MAKANKTVDRLAELIKIGRAWAEFSAELNGRGWHEYPDNIRAYLSGDRTHMAFEIDGLEIAYFDQPTIQLKLANLYNLEDYITRCYEELKKIKAEERKKSESEKEEARQARIKNLKEELEKLEE